MIASNLWIAIGFVGQFFFTMRFVVQWWASERRKASVIPLTFWHFSLLGGLILLAYAVYKRDPVWIVGQSTGSLIYARNLMFLRRDARPGAVLGDDRAAEPARKPRAAPRAPHAAAWRRV